MTQQDVGAEACITQRRPDILIAADRPGLFAVSQGHLLKPVSIAPLRVFLGWVEGAGGLASA